MDKSALKLPDMSSATARRYVEEMTRLYPEYEERLQGRPPREVDLELVVHGQISEPDLLEIYKRISEIPELEEEEAKTVDPFPGVSPEFLQNWAVLPWQWDETQITLLVSDPYAAVQCGYLFRKMFNRIPYFLITRRSLVDRLIRKTYFETDPSGMGDGASEESLINMASDARIVRLVNEMLSRSTELNASDIHIEPDEQNVTIRFRIDGLLRQFMVLPMTEYPAISSRIKLIGGLNIAESRLPQDGRANLQIGRLEMDVRISTIPIVHGESIVMRILRKDRIEFDLRNLGMDESVLERFDKLVKIPHGMILVAGPTGSGKTTTLYSVIAGLNRPDKKIITVEDPVEYRFAGLSQMQVNHKVGLTFANGLRSIVRQDPDIILVGEIRDRETAEIAVNAALTGHLVLSTIHTNDAPGAVSRLLDMGVESFLLSSALFGVISQRLVRKICPACHGKKVTPGMADDGTGSNICRLCRGSGYKGRMGIYELMIVNDDIRQAITQRRDNADIFHLAQKSGMTPLIEDGFRKVKLGQTTAEEVARAANTFNLEDKPKPVVVTPEPDMPDVIPVIIPAPDTLTL